MNREQCKGCAYFLAGGGGKKQHDTLRFCHYMLYTGERRKVGKKERCLSRTDKKRRMCAPFELPACQL